MFTSFYFHLPVSRDYVCDDNLVIAFLFLEVNKEKYANEWPLPLLKDWCYPEISLKELKISF